METNPEIDPVVSMVKTMIEEMVKIIIEDIIYCKQIDNAMKKCNIKKVQINMRLNI
jgi:hypothetical protein